MLESLRIKNVAVIDSAEVAFKRGLNILSGETGAGKSIVLEAISLILGSRASADLIRAGCDEAVVEGLFDIEEIPWMRERLTALGFENESCELLIRRSVLRTGKARIHVNGQLCTLTILQELTRGLVDLCSQHEHQSLVQPATQLELLDHYGGLKEQARAVAEAYRNLRKLEAERDELERSEAERSRRADFLKFQIDELEAAALEPGEDEKLAAEKQLLMSGSSRVQAAEAARAAIDTDDGGTLGALRGALTKLRALGALDDRAHAIREGLERAIAEAEETSLALGRYLASVDLDPERLAVVQERLSLIADLRRKYGAGVAEMLETLERLRAEHEGLGLARARREGLDGEIEAACGGLRELGLKLSAARHKTAEKLSCAVTKELKDLKMGEAKFTIELEKHKDLAHWSATGADTIQFVVRTNRGEEAKPLAKIASGGELSRLMLAIRRVIADRGEIGVYLFDEIDAGMGGQTAFEVGKKLKAVAGSNQVICITHLPQVASFADHHLVVRKTTEGKRTLTHVAALGVRERKEELARMLGGPELTKRSLENAAELMELAR